ncbi:MULTISPECIES: AAA family ATPase [Phocaeicola]|jgi:predicted ATP-dependent endonuclease of OLD family|uniref:AAA family ATPase n=1 Tax=Phocaeicola TaxID=909656 RepID=UPI0022E19E3C|nr:AAA family ATPase [Phocaeicola coprocola]
MKINIKGLGAIKETTIDLNKRLTVFCGHNNTGKTYVSYIIYALTSGRNFEPMFLQDDKLKSLLEEKKLILTIDKEDIWKYRNNTIKHIEENLNEIFGISKDQAIKYFPSFSIGFETSKDNFFNKILEESIEGKIEQNQFSLQIKKEKKSLDIQISMSSTDKISDNSIGFIQFMLLTGIYSSLAFYPITKSIIFPVERNSIYTFSKELSIKRNMLVDQMQDLSTKKIDPFDFLFKRTTRYPLPIRDGLEIAEDMNNLQKKDGDYKDFAIEIEEELLQGKVSVSNEGEVQFTSNKAKSKKLPIHLTASIVKTLSSLVFYLKYLAKKNDLIIIDEPELNLHPDNQVILTRLFARLINNGFRLLISTHSDYIVRELNNLIMLSNNNEEVGQLREKYGYSTYEYIDKNEVKAYYFDFKTKTTVATKELPVSDFGFDVPSIDNTIDKLNDVSEDLFYALKYGDNE